MDLLISNLLISSDRLLRRPIGLLAMTFNFFVEVMMVYIQQIIHYMIMTNSLLTIPVFGERPYWILNFNLPKTKTITH